MKSQRLRLLKFRCTSFFSTIRACDSNRAIWYLRLEAKALLQAHFLALLLFWEFYQCSRTLSVASACLRCGTLTHVLVHSLWGYLCFHSVAPQHLLALEGTPTTAAGSFLKNFLLLSKSFFVILCFSSLSILDQTSKSVPHFLGIGKHWLWLLSGCIGASQAVLSILVVPLVASKVTKHSRAFTTAASLFVSCFVPAAVVVCLDLRCFGGWALLWDQCRSPTGKFQAVYTRRVGYLYYNFKGMQTSDVCSPRHSPLSLSTCASTALLRLQDVWLVKFMSSALVIPAAKLTASRYFEDSSEVVGHLVIVFAFAIMTSGHLPLVMPLLYMSVLSETVLAASSWANTSMKHQRAQASVALSVCMCV